MKEMNIDEALSPAYWSAPTGRLYEVEDGSHISSVVRNVEQFGYTHAMIEDIYKKYNERIGEERKARSEIITSLINQGWIRIRHYPNRYWAVNVLQLDDRTKRFLREWAKKVLNNRVSQPDVYLTVRITFGKGDIRTMTIEQLASDHDP